MKKTEIELLGTTFSVEKMDKTSVRLEIDDYFLESHTERIAGQWMHNTLSNLLKVAEHFGTTDIGFNKVNISHCDTCGDEYIWELEVFNITKNYPF